MKPVFSLMVDPQTKSLMVVLHPGIRLQCQGDRWLLKRGDWEVYIQHDHPIGDLLAVIDLHDRTNVPSEAVMTLARGE